jgi:hypothetical protein
LERQALRDFSYLGPNPFWNWSWIGGMIGVLATQLLTSWLHVSGGILVLFPGWLVGLMAGNLAARLVGARTSDRRTPYLNQVRAEVRKNLLDHGMLRLLFEHDPSDRLPSLGSPSPDAFGQILSDAYTGTMQRRLETFIPNYEFCCRDMGLRCGGASQILPIALRLELVDILRDEAV